MEKRYPATSIIADTNAWTHRFLNSFVEDDSSGVVQRTCSSSNKLFLTLSAFVHVRGMLEQLTKQFKQEFWSINNHSYSYLELFRDLSIMSSSSRGSSLRRKLRSTGLRSRSRRRRIEGEQLERSAFKVTMLSALIYAGLLFEFWSKL